jgi:hypothetical protein
MLHGLIKFDSFLPLLLMFLGFDCWNAASSILKLKFFYITALNCFTTGERFSDGMFVGASMSVCLKSG